MWTVQKSLHWESNQDSPSSRPYDSHHIVLAVARHLFFSAGTSNFREHSEHSIEQRHFRDNIMHVQDLPRGYYHSFEKDLNGNLHIYVQTYLCPKFHDYGDNNARRMWFSRASTYCTSIR